MKSTFYTLILLVGLATSCNKSGELSSGIIKKNMDTLVNPGDNFARYVNGNWMKNTKIPDDKANFGAFDVLVDKSRSDVKAIIEEASKGKFEKGSDQQKIGDYYSSYMNRKLRDQLGIKPIESELNAIDNLANYSDLANYFGKANRKGFAIPFNLSVYTDFKDPNKYTLITWQGGLGLPEREYYLSKEAQMQSIRKQYLVHLEKMLQFINIPSPAENANTILALETSLASQQMAKEDTRDIMKLYNNYKISDLPKLFPDFDYKAMFQSAGFGKEKSVVVTQVEYLKSVNAIVKNTPLTTWKLYLKWSVLNAASTLLTTEIDQQNFQFYSKTLNGIEKEKEDWKRGVDAVNNGLGEIVGKVYVSKHFTPEAKERMTKMVKNLLAAYKESITNLRWMSKTTKQEALKKVDKFIVKIGYPDKWKDYSSLTINKNDLYGNTSRATAFEYERNLKKLGKPVDKTEWGMIPQTVNAYYNPTANEIVFPAAILQPPFFNLEAEDAVNYGGIGGVIGHEIGHGFDDQGSTFDGTGTMRNWWQPSDYTAFKERTGELVAQYSAFKVFPDLFVNGEYTLGENIGDLGGLSIAIKAYKLSLNGKEGPVMDGYTAIQRIFLGWGQVWLEKSRDAALRNQVASDPHSPALFRINGVVRNIPEFYKAFNVQPKDSLYLPEEKRVKIW
jgi:putative endopeptidase